MNRKLKRIFLDMRRDWQLYLFLIIPIIAIFIFCYIPMGGVIIAFKDYKVRKGIWGSDWVGFENFIRFFSSYQFGRIVPNTLILSLYSILIGFPFPICFALMINCARSKYMRKISQTIVNMPHFISVTVLVGILFQLFNSRTGLYGSIMELLTGEYPADLFASPSAFRHLYVWSGVWQNFGWSSVIYTAALAGVDPTYHEAAQLDGASRLQRILHVDIPCIMPTIIIQLILQMGSVMSVGYEKILLMQNGLNLSASEVISTYTYYVGLSSEGTSDFSYATAIGLFNSVINLIFILSANKISQKFSETSLW